MISPVRPVLAAIVFVALSACATGPKAQQFPQPTASWTTFTGQLQYTTPGNSLIGEFVASRHAADFHLEFSKGGAVPLIKVSRHEQLARAEGPLARGRWQGTAASAPPALGGWVEQVPKAFLTARDLPRRLEVPGGQPGEKFVFILNH